MSNFSELILVVGLVALGAAFYAMRRLFGWLPRSKMKNCDYLVFEAFPSHLPEMQADLSAHGWRLAKSEVSQSGAMLYRFEKADGFSAALSDIFDFGKSMPRTANRTTDADLAIKVHDYGSSRDANAKA